MNDHRDQSRNHPDTPGGRAWAAALSERDEHELLALVEGRLSAPQERVALSRWRSHPEAIRFVESAIGDRVSLSAAGESPAPDGLLDRVETVLERHLLIGSDEGASFSTGIESGTLVSAGPVVFVPPGSGRSRSWLGWRLAAAVLAVAGSAVVLTTRPWTPSSPESRGPSPLNADREVASSDTGTSDLRGAAIAALASSESGPGAGGDSHVRADVAGESGRLATGNEPDVTFSLAMDDTSVATPTASVAVAKSDDLPLAEAGSIDTDRAFELAKEGRLLVRVVTGSVTASMDRLRDSRDRRLSEAAWSVNTSPVDRTRIADAAESVRPLRSRREVASPGMPEPALRASSMPMVSHSGGLAPPTVRSVPMPLAPMEWNNSPRRAVATIDVEASSRGVDALLHALSTRGSTVVEFVELSEPIGPGGVFDPSQVLWWTRPPSAWTPRVTVPVVFEQP